LAPARPRSAIAVVSAVGSVSFTQLVAPVARHTSVAAPFCTVANSRVASPHSWMIGAAAGAPREVHAPPTYAATAPLVSPTHTAPAAPASALGVATGAALTVHDSPSPWITARLVPRRTTAHTSRGAATCIASTASVMPAGRPATAPSPTAAQLDASHAAVSSWQYESQPSAPCSPIVPHDDSSSAWVAPSQASSPWTTPSPQRPLQPARSIRVHSSTHISAPNW
jgi:hypothetical protein